MYDLNAFVKELVTVPKDEHTFGQWIEMPDVPPFLRSNARRQEIIVDLSATHAFIHAIAVPKINVTPPDIEDLLFWELSPRSSWGIDVIYSGGNKSIGITEPMSEPRCKSFRNAERLIFPRAFEGRQGSKQYYELLQKFAHVFDLHMLPERNAYCRLDRRGDVEAVVQMAEIPGRTSEWGTSIVTFDRTVLDEYLALTDSVLVVAFDFTRFRSEDFFDWHELGKYERVVQDDLLYRVHIEPGHASYMRGVHIVESTLSKEDVIKQLDHSVKEPREYASFIAWDFKNRVLRDISTAPNAIANYFTKSDLPFETSPAFFRPEVLLKYKNDSDKYRLEDRSITCRNAWHLETYDINDAGQVHTYLIYLQRLPFDEQLYWKSYNEEPKAPISKRAFTNDFEGDWYNEYDPLLSLKAFAAELDHAEVPWWTLRSEGLAPRVHYPVTTSVDEWANEILGLDQLLVEGFEEKWLKKKAIELGRNFEAAIRSLKLVEECLIGLGMDEIEARSVTAPMHKLHWLRSKLKGHAPGTEAIGIREQVLKEHGSYAKQFRALCAECDEGLRIIAEQLNKVL